MRTLLVAVREPSPQRLPGLIQCLDVMKPETLLFYSSDQLPEHAELRQIRIDISGLSGASPPIAKITAEHLMTPAYPIDSS